MSLLIALYVEKIQKNVLCLFAFQELAALDVIHKSVWVEVRQIVIKFSDIHVSDRNWSLDTHCD